jgi:uncharacterized protein
MTDPNTPPVDPTAGQPVPPPPPPPQAPQQPYAQQPPAPPQQPQYAQPQQPQPPQYAQQPPQYAQQPPQYAQQPQYAQPVGPVPLSANEDKQWAMWSHIGGIIGFLPSLIIFLVFKDRGQRTAVESKEALNWQITWSIIYVALWIVFSILSAILLFTPVGFIIGLIYFLPLVWWILDIIFSITGGMRVNAGGSYRYPFNFRFIK